MIPLPTQRPPYLAAAVAAGAVWLLYVVTLAPTTAFWDASEYIATAHILGIPHPPGNPLFVVVGRVWSLLLEPFGLSVAVRINLLAATTSAVASFFLYLVAHRILIAGEPDGWAVRLAAGVSVFLGGTAFTVWNQSNVNEKVYTLSMAVLAAVVWLVVRWRDRIESPGSVRYLLAAVFLMAIGITNHLMSLLPLPAVAAFVLWVRPAALADRTFWARGLVLVLVGISFNLFLPIRSAQMPVINEGQPVCESAVGAAVATFTLGQSGCRALASSLTREQYGKPPVTERQAPMGHQFLNWYQYFDWQWARGMEVSDQPGGGRTPVTLVFLLMGVLGLVRAYRTDRAGAVLLSVLALTLTVGLVLYLNFRYGYSLAPEIQDRALHEVRERDYFFIAGFHLWGVLAGLGLAGLWRGAAVRFGGRLRTLPLLAPALLPLLLNWGWATRAEDHAARDWAYNLLQSVAPYGVLFTNGDNDTFPLWYLQEVEEIRRDVTVVVVQYLFTDWYPEQLRYLSHPDRQRPFEEIHRTGVHDAPERSPGAPVFAAPPQRLEEISGGVVGEGFAVTVGRVALTFPDGTFLNRGQLLALLLLSDNWGERPLYFASTAGLAQSLGLDGWTIREGLAYRLTLDEPGDSPGVVRTSPTLGAEWVDVNRSLTLAREVFSYRGFRDREVWADRATLNIPWHIYFLHLQLADAAERAGRSRELVASLQADAEAFLVTARGGIRGGGSP